MVRLFAVFCSHELLVWHLRAENEHVDAAVWTFECVAQHCSLCRGAALCSALYQSPCMCAMHKINRATTRGRTGWHCQAQTGKRDGHDKLQTRPDKLRTESHKRDERRNQCVNRWRSATPAHSALQPCRRRTHFAPLFGTQLATPSLSVSKIHSVLSKARALNPDDRCATYYRALHVAQDKAGPFVAVLTALRCL